MKRTITSCDLCGENMNDADALKRSVLIYYPSPDKNAVQIDMCPSCTGEFREFLAKGRKKERVA